MLSVVYTIIWHYIEYIVLNSVFLDRDGITVQPKSLRAGKASNPVYRVSHWLYLEYSINKDFLAWLMSQMAGSSARVAALVFSWSGRHVEILESISVTSSAQDAERVRII
ncbi:hypothetical protein E1301_Tti023594 [Triplophysa tibetana]|uniref:Uncharacterized protein n=1 Tax=Triplophysa tibetana TaxID=1572043 RepID=A0A5A9NJA9_9TELE|nr:hypothetical protein E1301_Tti019869 [Triplophysa tibetana]KAA0709850.1 hypothetical protein E1301_Tti023594 [Triplophysa tibetana]